MTRPADRGAHRLGRRPRLNGVRGVSVLLIVAYHFSEALGGRNRVPGGFVGVDVFFVLSGFLITALLLDEWESAGRISFRNFYVRRALRLFPALAVFLVACAAIYVRVEGGLEELMGRFLVGTAFYVANLYEAFGHDMYWAHTWSLSAEEQFYLVWPLALVVMLRRGLPRRVIVGVTAIVALLPACARLVLWNSGPERDLEFVFYSPFTHADGLLFGCLLAELYVWRMLPSRPRPLAIAGGVSLVALVVAAFTVDISDGALYDGAYLLIVVAGGALVLACAEEVDAWPLRVLDWRVLTYTGEISYAFYLWNPLFLFNYPATTFHPVLGVVLAFGVSAASFRFVETPALRLKARFASVRHQAPVVVEPAPLANGARAAGR